MKKLPLPKYLGIPLALVIVAVALGVQHLLQPYVGTILFLAMYPVIFISTWVGGTTAGLVALAFTIIGVDYYFMGEPGTHFMLTLPDVIRISLFSLTNLLIIWILSRVRKAEKKLRDSEMQYRTLVELSPHFIWFTDKNGQNTYINKTMTRYTGFTLDRILKEGWTEFIHPSDVQRVREVWKETIQKAEPKEFEIRIKNQNGDYRWFMVKSMPILDEKGNVERWIGTTVDFHEQKMSLITRDVFFSFASHELKTPLTGLKLKIQVMDRKIKDNDPGALSQESVKQFIDTAANKVEVFQGIIDEMLDVSRITSGKMSYFFDTYDVSQILKKSIDTMAPQFAEAQVKLTVNADESLAIMGDQTKLLQVFMNLLSNALKYGNKQPVEIKLTNRGQKLTVDIIDQGMGIAPENHDRIFNCFERVDEYSASGLGVGLFISRQIVEDHRGHLLLTSTPGKGSTFTVELPIDV